MPQRASLKSIARGLVPPTKHDPENEVFALIGIIIDTRRSLTEVRKNSGAVEEEKINFYKDVRLKGRRRGPERHQDHLVRSLINDDSVAVTRLESIESVAPRLLRFSDLRFVCRMFLVESRWSSIESHQFRIRP